MENNNQISKHSNTNNMPNNTMINNNINNTSNSTMMNNINNTPNSTMMNNINNTPNSTMMNNNINNTPNSTMMNNNINNTSNNTMMNNNINNTSNNTMMNNINNTPNSTMMNNNINNTSNNASNSNQNGNAMFTNWNENTQKNIKQEDKPYLVVSDEELKSMRKKSGALRFVVYSFFLIVGLLVVYMYQLDKYEFYLDKDNVLIGTGSSCLVNLIPKNMNVFDAKNYRYEIVDTNIAEVDEFGKISTKVSGITELKVKYKNGINYKTMKVTVEDIDVQKVSLKETNESEKEVINLEVDDSTQIESVVNDRSELNVDVDYRSSDEEVIQVDENGNITTVGEGEAYIIGETPDGTVGDVKVVVEPKIIEVSSVKVPEKSIILKVGSTGNVLASVVPEDATDNTLKYTSDNGNVTVDSEGNVKGVSVGQSTITITSSNGNMAYVTVIVKEESVSISAIDLNIKNKEIKIGEESQLEAVISPANATLRELIWETTNSNIANVKGGKIKGISEGTATITVKTADGNIKDQCNVVVKTNKVAISNLKLQANDIVLKKDKKVNLEVIIEPSNATERMLTYKSDNDNVVVDQSGTIIGKKVGNSVITITSSNGKMVKCNVKVTDDAVEPTGITLDKAELTLNGEDSYKLVSTISPQNATLREVTWNSQNPNVASVSNGKVVAKAEGETIITVVTSNGKTASCKVNVKIPVTSVSIIGEQNLKVGGTKQLSATITPSTANKNVSWLSSNQNIAKVDKNGLVTGISSGTVEISATTADGIIAKKTMTIESNEIVVTSIKINPENVNIKAGEKINLSYVIEPSNATNKNVTWSSSNAKIATIANGTLTGIDIGKTEITVKTNNGKTAKVVVNVSKNAEVILPTSISFKSKDNMSLDIGATTTLSYTIEPNNATSSVTWSSNKPDIVSVDNGVVKPLKEGSATITVKTSNGKEAQQLIIVKKSEIKVSSVKLNKNTLDLNVGEKTNLLATINPTNAKAVLSWISSNTNVVKVDSNGGVEAINAGDATITVKTSEGLEDKCKVKVSKLDLKLDKSRLEIKVGETGKLNATVSNNTSNAKINWSSSNDNVATVDSNGIVTGISKGKADVIAKLDTGEYAYANVEVTKKYNSSSIITVNLDNQGGTANDVTTFYTKDYSLYRSNDLKNEFNWDNLKDPSKNNYTFLGYYTEKNGKGKRLIEPQEDEGIDTLAIFNYAAYDVVSDVITLYAHWQKNQVKINYYINFDDDSYPGFKPILNSNDKTISTDSRYILQNGNDYYQEISSDSSLGKSGLIDYNNPKFVNISSPYGGIRVKPGAEWCTKSNGKGKCFDQSKDYKASDICDAKNESCEVTLYLNWETFVFSYELNNQGATKAGSKIIYSKRVGYKGLIKAMEYYSDANGKNEISSIKVPTKENYVFDGYYTKKDGKGIKIIDEDGNINTRDLGNEINDKNILYANWVSHKVFIGFSTGKDGVATIAKQHGNKVSVSGTTLITKEPKFKYGEYQYYNSYWDKYYSVNPSAVFHIINYGGSLGKGGLADYNNSSYINLTSSKAFIKKGEEWNTKEDGTGKSYDQSKVYKASDFCDVKNNNCFVNLYANWKLNVKKISFASSWQNTEFHMTSNGQNIKKGDITPSIIKVNVEPSGTGINPGITWKSSDTKILKIVDPGNDQNGQPIYSSYGNTKLQVTGFGKVKLTATSANGKSTSVNIEVTEKYLKFKS